MTTTTEHRCRRRLMTPCLLAVMILTVAATPVLAVDFALRSDFLDEGSLRVGEDQEVFFDVVVDNDRADFDSSIQAYQLAVFHDDAHLDFVDVAWQGTALDTPDLRDGQGPSFFFGQEVQGQGVTLGVVFDADAINGFLLGFGDHVVARLRYRGLPASSGQPSTLGFANSLGDPAIINKVNTFGGSVVEPDLGGPVTVSVSGEVIYSIHFGGNALVNVENGDPFTLPIRLHNNPLDVTGFSFGVAYDSAILTLDGNLEAGLGLSTVLDGQSLDDFSFFVFNEITDTGGAIVGFTVGMIFSDQSAQASDDPLKVLPASEEGYHILNAKFEATGLIGSLTSVDVVDNLGDPEVDVLLDINGVSKNPEVSNPVQTSVSVQVGEFNGVPFLRSDVDQDTRVNLTDALNIVKFQFTPDDVPQIVRTTGAQCFGAFDVNGDNSVTVGDALNLLTFLFSTGPRPAAPYPDCGFPENPPLPGLFCLSYSCP